MKGVLALAGAAALALIAKFTGLDFSSGSDVASAGSGDGSTAPPAEPGPVAVEAPEKKNSAKDESSAAKRDDTAEIQRLFRANRSDVIVEAEGEVVHLLPDDTRGSQHQLFLVQLTNDITLKLSHNIDLAPRVDALRKGDTIRFHGEYEWNAKGGVVHWTHRNTRGGSHEHGWLEHEGQRYW